MPLLLALLASPCAHALDPFELDPDAFGKEFVKRFQYPPPKPEPAEIPDAREGQAADAAYLAAFPDYDRAYSPAAREAARRELAELRRDARTLSHEQFVMRAAHIAALADNGHTVIGENAFRKNTPRLPLRMYWFPDGLYVLRASPQHADLLGARIDSIDGRTPEALFAVLRDYKGGPDNRRRLALIPVFESPALLEAVGLARSRSELTLAGVKSDGTAFEQRVPGEERGRSAPVSSTPRVLFPAEPNGIEGLQSLLADGADLPIYLRYRQHVFSMDKAPHEGLYVALGVSMDIDEGRVSEFLTAMLARVARDKPRYVALDLRMNGGGDYTQTYPFMAALVAVMGPKGRIYALTSGWTFSAAITTLGALKQAGGEGVEIVGTPVGDRLAFWAEGGAFVLPNAFIAMNYTTARHDYRHRCADLEVCFWLNELYPVRVRSLDPDIAAPLTFAAYRDRRDPAMEAVYRREASR